MLKLKSGDIILNDIISIAYVTAITFQSIILYISVLAGFPVFIMFLAKQFINCMLAQNNGIQILLKLIALTVVISNQSQLRGLYNFVSSNCFRLTNAKLIINSNQASMSINQIFTGPAVLLIAVFISIYIIHCMLDWPSITSAINQISSGPVQYTIYELTNGIETPLLFIIEYIYFHRFKRLNRFIYSSFSWFINRAYNHILVYYHNLIFAMISSAYGTKYIHGIYHRSISDSQMDAGYVIGYQIESLSRGLGLIYLVIAFIIYLISLNYVTRYYRPNVLEIGIGYNFYILSGLFAISSDN